MRNMLKFDRQKETPRNGFFFGNAGIGKSNWLYRGERSLTNDNLLVIGTPGSGKCHHPWDNLKPCVCGCKERPVLVYKNGDAYYCGGEDTVLATCPSCGRHTDEGTLGTTIENWNHDRVQEAKGESDEENK